MSILDILNLQFAYERVLQDSRDDAWHDATGYRDTRRVLDEIVDSYKGKTTDEIIRGFRPGLLIDIPKHGFTLRPVVIPSVVDRILYQAISDYLIQFYQPEPPLYSHGYAGKKSKSMFLPGVQKWLEFQNAVKDNCEKFPYVVHTDLSAYFDHIEHSHLCSRINDLFSDQVEKGFLSDISFLLKGLLGKWKIGFMSTGIPQLNDSSSFFGNIYLDVIDKWVEGHGIHAIRYVDDFRIFADSESSARRLLADFLIELRTYGLYVSGGKTFIKPSSMVKAELFERNSSLSRIDNLLSSGRLSEVEEALSLVIELYERVASDKKEIDGRLYRFCINRLKKLKASGIESSKYEMVARDILGNLITMPESTDVFIDFLSLFTTDQYIQSSVVDFIQSSYNLYPWQEQHLLDLLIRLSLEPQIASQVKELCHQIIRKNDHDASVAKATILLGKIGTYADRKEIRHRYSRETRELIRRAVVFSIQETQKQERGRFYREISKGDISMTGLVQFVESFDVPIYHYYHPPSAFDIVTEVDSDDLADLGMEYFS